MTSARHLFALLAAIASGTVLMGTVACGGPSCEATCRRFALADCDGDGAADGVAGTCASTCSSYQALVEVSSCQNEFDAYLSCSASSNECASNPCPPESEAFSSCVTTFCEANPSVAACEGV